MLVRTSRYVAGKALLELSRIAFTRDWYSEKWFENSRAGYGWLPRALLFQKAFGVNRHVQFPISPFISVGYQENVLFDPTSLNVFQGVGKYFNPGVDSTIKIGKDCYMSSNVGLIGVAHNLYELDKADPGEDIVIGDNSWIGMNAMIVGNIELGPRTIVGAGSVVTKSFENGNVIIAGNPARVLREL